MNRRYRKTLIIGNWKMNKPNEDAKEFLTQLKSAVAKAKWCDVAVCVPFTNICNAVRNAKGVRIEIGAQNVHFAESGAYTGEISCEMLMEAGAKYVIVGHSERREQFGETDEIVNKKVTAALQSGLKPIVCVGESLKMRELGITFEKVCMQVKTALHGVNITDLRRIVIAYEPIWAIGTGKTATAAMANEVCEAIRECLRSLYGARAARAVSILYGGSMNEKNAFELLSMPDVDGGLIGGASLTSSPFCEIINAANQPL